MFDPQTQRPPTTKLFEHRRVSRCGSDCQCLLPPSGWRVQIALQDIFLGPRCKRRQRDFAGIRLSKTYAECQRRKLSDNQPTQPDDLLVRGRKAIRSIRVKMKGLLVRFDREPTGSPAIEASLEEFDP